VPGAVLLLVLMAAGGSRRQAQGGARQQSNERVYGARSHRSVKATSNRARIQRSLLSRVRIWRHRRHGWRSLLSLPVRESGRMRLRRQPGRKPPLKLGKIVSS
jgi:hypothetical protein